ncbi:MAG: Plug domain-containing protein, partial [Cyanobacteria bacterium P01_D01_bin.56]
MKGLSLGLNLALLLALLGFSLPQQALGQELESAVQEDLFVQTTPEESEEPEEPDDEDNTEATDDTEEAEEETLRIVVTGEEGSRYIEPNASTATRTDTPLREIPQSIQIIPQEVLEDQQVIRLNDALRNASGVVSSSLDQRGQKFILRGFNGAAILRDGFRLLDAGGGNSGFQELSNVEQIEVLKGPASILSGA